MRWFVIPEDTRDLAVHAALVHTGHAGQIVYFGGDQHDPVSNLTGDYRHTRIFDCAALAPLDPPPRSPDFDSFCCGHSLLGDGRLLIAGGTDNYPQDAEGVHTHQHFTGLRQAAVFDPERRTWTDAPEMAHGRWYPSLVTLPNATALALDGHTDGAQLNHANNSPDVYAPNSNSWFPQRPHGDPGTVVYYPRAHVLPDWSVFVVTPQSGMYTDSERYNWIDDTWTTLASAVVPGGYSAFNTTSVLLPLEPPYYTPRVLVLGNVIPYVIDLGTGGARTYVPTPRVAAWPDTPPVRQHVSAVMLPTGQIFVCGGLQNELDDNTHVFEPEMFDPASGTWQRLEALATVPRGYHSVALLMPDGRVWTAGGSIDKSYAFHQAVYDPTTGNVIGYRNIPDHRQLHIEIFEPDYFSATRPVINGAPGAVRTGSTFEVETPHTEMISRATMVRAGSTTHAFNGDQRLIELRILGREPGLLRLEAPPDPGIAPPGYYLLFILDEAAIPSLGKFVRVDYPGCLVDEIAASQTNRVERQQEMTRKIRPIRHFRNSHLRQLERGRWLETVIQRHAAEIRRLLEENSQLRAEAHDLILIGAELVTIADGESPKKVGAKEAGRLETFFVALDEEASEELKEVIRQIRSDLPSLQGCSLHEFAGMLGGN